MRKLILLTGDVAAGKSTYSKILAERYGIYVLNKDPIKELLCDTVGFSGREENLRLSAASTAMMGYMFAGLAKLGLDCIMEANFRTAELQGIKATAEKNGYELLTLLFRADVPILHERYLCRIRDENRHPGHLSEPLEDIESFAAYIEAGRRERIPMEYVEIDAGDFSYKTDARLFALIDGFMGK